MSTTKENNKNNKNSKNDKISRPKHYRHGGHECIEVIKDVTGDSFEGYLTGNIIKYLYRYKDKNGVEDLQKAQQYLKWLIDYQTDGTIALPDTETEEDTEDIWSRYVSRKILENWKKANYESFEEMDRRRLLNFLKSNPPIPDEVFRKPVEKTDYTDL